MIVELLDIALGPLGENMAEPIVGLVMFALILVAVAAVAFLFFLRRR